MFQCVLDAIGNHGAFWFFGSVCCFGLFFVIFCVPETQGKSLEDIERKMLATELIRRTRPIILRSISSRDFPCVSGTQNITKNRPKQQTDPKNQKAP